MDRRNLFMFLAAGCALLVVGIEIGSSFFLSSATPAREVVEASMIEEGIGADERQEALDKLDDVANADDPPGLAIPALALLDIFLFLSLGSLALSAVVPHRVMARITAPTNLVVSILVILGALVLFVITVALIFLMVGLFLFVPFGTIVYLVRWGFFPRGDAQFTLGLLLFLKTGVCVFGLLASPRLITSKGLVALVISSVVAQMIVSFLHALVPGILVSVTDAIATLIVLIIAIIWAIIVLVGSIVGTVRLIPSRVPSGELPG